CQPCIAQLAKALAHRRHCAPLRARAALAASGHPGATA
ncbi:unnamed protein product, partial [Arctia plantaginis]